jgi:hypothetical protein
MSVVIVGGHDRMVRQYKDICAEYGCKAKVFTQMKSGMKGSLGNPDMAVLFTGTMSHKMLRYAMNELGGKTRIVRSHVSSGEALRGIISKYA